MAMSDCIGRLWPVHIPFMNINEDGKPAIVDGHECILKPGDYQFTTIEGDPVADAKTAQGFTFVCPKTAKKCGTIVIGYPNKPSHSPSWQFDGNQQAPTLRPSIDCRGGCKWHGFLTNGVFKQV
jgi:hypothetical protein